MSEVIVRMEMPKSCDVCPCLDDYGDYPRCRISNEQRGYNFPIREKRMQNCPIIGELPEQHGDLIDMDVSIQTFKCIEEAPYSGFDGQEPFYAPEDVVNTLLCQDVVIASTKRSKNHEQTN